jgi:NAD(P)-dependent dehydrogenase (short-subunit alcohol dehydrogenase family)
VRASVGTGGFAAYAATKGAIEAFTRAMAHEFRLTASPSR